MLDPVSDWATDFEIFDDEYVRSPFKVWDELRERCPIAHTNRRASTWLPTRYDDVVALARDIEHFSSRGISVVPAADLSRPAGPHLDAPAFAPMVLPSASRGLRTGHTRTLPTVDRGVPRHGSSRCCGGVFTTDPRSGDLVVARCARDPF